MVNNLGSYLGRKDREHITAFSAAGVRGWHSCPRRCEAHNGTPPHKRCGRVARVGSRYCARHAPLKEQIALDEKIRPRLLKTLASSRWERARKDAERQLASIDRRAMRFLQIHVDPRAGIELIKFERAEDRERCENWLREKGYALDAPSPVSGEPPSTLARTRCLFAAMRFLVKQNINEQKALESILRAHRADKRFFDKHPVHENVDA